MGEKALRAQPTIEAKEQLAGADWAQLDTRGLKRPENGAGAINIGRNEGG
jgi:hypothetical protein